MPHRLDLYVRHESALHRIDARAKAVAAAGFTMAVLLLPSRPYWSAGALLLILLGTAALARIPVRTICRRLLPLALVIGAPFLLSRLGGEATRAAGEQFAVKSLLVAGGFVVLLASTRVIVLLEIAERLPLLSTCGQLGGFIVRGANLLVEEVIRANRSWKLRAARASTMVRLQGLIHASIGLVARAASRSERVGAAMVLRGFQGRLPTGVPSRLPWSHLVAGVVFGLVSLGIAGVGRWG